MCWEEVVMFFAEDTEDAQGDAVIMDDLDIAQ
jgi:hypothetical protein